VSAVEVTEVGVLVAKLARRGISVRVEGGRVLFAGEARDLFGETGMATLVGRERAVSRALERGAAWGEAVARERDAASAAVRRGRTPRASHAKKIPPAEGSR